MSEGQTYHHSEIFVPTQWTKRPEVVVGRDEIFSKLSSFVHTSGAHALLYGQRGVGKTTIRDHFSRTLPETGMSVQTIIGSPGLTYAGMISRLLAKLGFFDVATTQETKGSVSANIMGLRGDLQSTSRYEKPPLDIYDADAVAEVLYDHSPQFGTLIVIDEFDIISRKRDEESIHFNLPFLLRACTHLPDDKGVHFLIVGLAFSGDSVIEGHPSLARSMIDLRVSRIKKDDVRYFFEKGFELAGFSIDRATLDYLVMCSAGYPYTMHYLGDSLCEVAEARSRRNISGDLVRIALPISRQNYPRKNAISYRGRSLNEVEILLRMAYSWKDGITAKDILSSSVSDQKISGADEVISVLESLVKQELLNRVSGTDVYYFVDPYTRVKVMLDRESKEIEKSRYYPSSGHDDLPLFNDDV